MKKTKKTSIMILIFVFLILISRSNSVKAITNEGTTGTNAGGPSMYTKWFDDFTGVLIVTSTFANGSGCESIDITVVVTCIEANRAFRLRIWDSDEEQFINPENEVGLGTCERRFGVNVHMDSKELTWIAMVTDETGLVFLAEVLLYFVYDIDAEYDPVIPDDDDDSISAEEQQREILYVNLSYIVTISLTVLFTGALVIQREGTGIKSLYRSKVKKSE